MIDLYCADTGNSLRALLALEECALPYRRHIVDMEGREHKSQSYLRLNPFGRVPAMVDQEGPSGKPLTIVQSTTIMLYAAEKSGRLVPPDAASRAAVLDWCLMAASDASPTSALLTYLSNGVPDFSPGSRSFLEDRLRDLMLAVDRHLAADCRTYLLGDLSLADLALFPVVRMRRSMLEERNSFTHLFQWADRVAARPAVMRAMTF